MAPELRYYVPDEKEKAFKKAVSSLKGMEGVRLVGRLRSEGERQRLESEASQRFAELIAELRKPKTRRVQAEVNAAFHLLVADTILIIEGSSLESKRINTSVLKRAVGDIFTDMGSRPWIRLRAEALIHRYGLIDEKFKNYDEVGEIVGSSEDTVLRRVSLGRRFMYGAFHNLGWVKGKK